jgi:hemoglobin
MGLSEPRSLPVDVPTSDLADVEDVDRFVRAFYRRVATDELLGPIFEAAAVDWTAHIPKLVDFWALQLFGVRGYEGNPLRAHAPVHAARPFQPAHYARWLDLFDETIDDLYAGPVTEFAKARARKMANALQRLLDGVHGPPEAPVTAAAPVVMAGSIVRDRR